jgi:hypothetical protein
MYITIINENKIALLFSLIPIFHAKNKPEGHHRKVGRRGFLAYIGSGGTS